MSVIGKGRGRGFTDVRDVSLRRPGQLNKSKFNDLINFMDNLSIKDIISRNKLDDIVQLFKSFLENNPLKEIFDDLYKQALEDRQFGLKLAISCSEPKMYTLNDSNLRLILLQTLQKDYEEREQLKEKSITQFRNAISFMGGVYCNLKLNGKPMDILTIPLLHYLELLLYTSEEEDIELVTVQVLINGLKMVEQSPTGTENFLLLIRQVLVNRNLSAKSRAMLLFIIDSSNLQFKPLPGKLKEVYYKVDGNPFIEIEDHIYSIYNSTTSATDSSELHNPNILFEVENNLSSVMKEISQEGVNSGCRLTERSLPNSKKPAVPRAIRGAGAVDSTKDKNINRLHKGSRDKMTDDQIWSSKQNTNSKVWGHDDRFDKDYSQN